MTLGDYFQEKIFTPLGIKSISFHPDKSMRENLVCCQQRFGNMTLECEQLLRRAIVLADEPNPAQRSFEAGGAGCFANPKEYCRKSEPAATGNPHDVDSSRHGL